MLLGRSAHFAAVSALLIVASLTRIIFSYSETAQAFDEPCHIAAGMELLDRGTYTLDPIHPTLARVAIALPLYASGERYPTLAASDSGSHNYNVVGNHILYDSRHLRRNLDLARTGVLPFFILGAVIVYLWTRRLGNDLCALVAVFLYSTTPAILAFSSIAYTDIVAASTQVAALYTFWLWLQTPNRVHTVLLGIALGGACLAKLTSLLFLPAAALCMLVTWVGLNRAQRIAVAPYQISKILIAIALTGIIVWAGYGFSMRHIQEVTGISEANMPTFQHFPRPMRSSLQELIVDNPRVPAGELFNGMAKAWALNKTPSQSYLFGEVRTAGWWYFYLAALSVKLPIPLLLLFVISAIALFTRKNSSVSIYLPFSALIGILLVTTRVNYQVGTRHVLVCIPLIVIVVGTGIGNFIGLVPRRRDVSLWLLAALLCWQGVESARSQSDFLAYFNEFAGTDPSRALVMGCDLDCGQDLFRLARELRNRDVDRVTLAIWTSADLSRSNLPAYTIAGWNGPVKGWFAISERALRMNDALPDPFPPHYFDWLESVTPAAKVGATIRLYYLTSEQGSQPQFNTRKN